MNLWEGYLRWRHSKGYGVHSPFAYKFITDVLKPGQYGYYAYEQLPFLSRGQSIERGRDYREAKFLIRLAIFLHIKRIISYGKKSAEAQLAAKALKILYFGCESNSEPTFKNGDILIIPSGVFPDLSIVGHAIEKNVPILSYHPSADLRNFLESPIDKGVLFTGKSKILLINREEMNYVGYSINF